MNKNSNNDPFNKREKKGLCSFCINLNRFCVIITFRIQAKQDFYFIYLYIDHNNFQALLLIAQWLERWCTSLEGKIPSWWSRLGQLLQGEPIMLEPTINIQNLIYMLTISRLVDGCMEVVPGNFIYHSAQFCFGFLLGLALYSYTRISGHLPDQTILYRFRILLLTLL